MLLKQNLVFKISHAFLHTNKSKILPVLSLLIARSCNISLRKIQYFSPNFMVRKFSVNEQFPGESSGESPENLQKLLVYGKFPHREIR